MNTSVTRMSPTAAAITLSVDQLNSGCSSARQAQAEVTAKSLSLLACHRGCSCSAPATKGRRLRFSPADDPTRAVDDPGGKPKDVGDPDEK